MKFTRDWLAALAGAAALAVSVPAVSQGMGQSGMGAAQNAPNGSARPNDRHDMQDMHRDMHGNHMNSGDRLAHGNARWHSHRRHCHTVWRHHRRVRVCHRG